jgi:hypothetical protein
VKVGQIIEKAGENFAFANPDFISSLLEKATAITNECYRSVCSSAYSSVVSGSRSGVVGQPMPRDLEVRDKASLLAKRFQNQPNVRTFYSNLAKGAEANIRRDREEFEEQFSE